MRSGTFFPSPICNPNNPRPELAYARERSKTRTPTRSFLNLVIIDLQLHEHWKTHIDLDLKSLTFRDAFCLSLDQRCVCNVHCFFTLQSGACSCNSQHLCPALLVGSVSAVQLHLSPRHN